MKNCHTCGTEARDEARYCRSCYAVFADGAAVGLARPDDAKKTKYLIQAALILALVIGFALSRLDFQFLSDTAQTDAGTNASSDAVPKTAAKAERAASSSSGQAENTWGLQSNSVAASSVRRLGDSCAISQAVHNGGERIMFPVALDFSFENALGQRIGDPVRAATETILPAGEQRGFTFEMPCPQTFAHVQVHAVSQDAAISGAGTAQAVAALLAGKPLIDMRQLHLAIQVPDDLTMCPGLHPCQLMLYFNDSWIAVWFRRDPRNPDMLIASDPQLIGPLQQGWNAQVRLPLRHGAQKLTITNEYLREPESTGLWASLKGWIGKMAGTTEEKQ